MSTPDQDADTPREGYGVERPDEQYRGRQDEAEQWGPPDSESPQTAREGYGVERTDDRLADEASEEAFVEDSSDEDAEQSFGLPQESADGQSADAGSYAQSELPDSDEPFSRSAD
ncbi:hypothetical protein [Microbacterium lacusdiani]